MTEKRTSDRAGDEGPLLNLLAAIFLNIAKCFPGHLVVNVALRAWPLTRNQRRNAVDVWVTGNMGLAIAAAAIASSTLDKPPQWILIFECYAILRVAEIIVSQANVLIFTPYVHGVRYINGIEAERYKVFGRYRLVVLLACNFIEIAAWYSLAFAHLVANGSMKAEFQLEGGFAALMFFMQAGLRSLVTFGIADGLTPLPSNLRSWPYFLIVSQSFVGMFMTIAMLARFLSLLPSPGSEAEPD